MTAANLPAASAVNYAALGRRLAESRRNGSTPCCLHTPKRKRFFSRALSKAPSSSEEEAARAGPTLPGPPRLQPQTVIWASELLSAHRPSPPLPCICWLRRREDAVQQRGTLGSGGTARTSLAARVSKLPATGGRRDAARCIPKPGLVKRLRKGADTRRHGRNADV